MARLEPSVVTVDIHYNNPGFDGATQDLVVVVDCPSETAAINGGIVQSVADTGWSSGAAAAAAVGGATGPGSAIVVSRAGTIGGSDLTNASYPRPVNSGGSWQMGVQLTFPY